jgi:hypothetical protein
MSGLKRLFTGIKKNIHKSPAGFHRYHQLYINMAKHPDPTACHFIQCNYNDGISFSRDHEMHAESPVRGAQFSSHDVTCLLNHTGLLAVLSYILVNYHDKIPPKKFINLYQ